MRNATFPALAAKLKEFREKQKNDNIDKITVLKYKIETGQK